MYLHWIHSGLNPRHPIVITIPHSGEILPPEAAWLGGLSEQLLLTDVDRFVDRLYEPAARELRIPALRTSVHRYAADLNRVPEDVDQDSVEGASFAPGAHSKGFHWVQSTLGERIMQGPISREVHESIVRLYHVAFHAEFARKLAEIRDAFPGKAILHLDCHSMPSRGTPAHQDSGKPRPDVVISDVNGKSSSAEFKDAVIAAFEGEGFRVSYNWPYQGGRITQRYGKPDLGHHTIQIELNRALYMDEATKEPLAGFGGIPERLRAALGRLVG